MDEATVIDWLFRVVVLGVSGILAWVLSRIGALDERQRTSETLQAVTVEKLNTIHFDLQKNNQTHEDLTRAVTRIQNDVAVLKATVVPPK